MVGLSSGTMADGAGAEDAPAAEEAEVEPPPPDEPKPRLSLEDLENFYSLTSDAAARAA